MSIRVYWHEKRQFWDVDIRVRMPDGTYFRERRRSPAQSQTGAMKWAKARAAHIALNGVTRISERRPTSRVPGAQSIHDEQKLATWLESRDPTWDGWVYFIQGPNGAIKIGWARDVAARLADLQAGCPEMFAVLGVRPGAVVHERLLHRRFSAAHVRGEWFSPVPELLAFVGSHAERFERGVYGEQTDKTG